MALLVLANDATATYRRVYFDLRDATDGITAETGEAGGQPQISTNGGAWTNTGIGTLSAIGNGRYYAELTQAAVANAGDVIETRYKSANTAETPGDTVQVVAFNPRDATALGLSRLDAAVSSRASQTSLDTLDDYVDSEVATVVADVAAIKAKTDTLPASPAAVGSVMTLDLTQALTDVATGTVGGGLMGGWVSGFGKAVIDTTLLTLTLYAPDNATVLKTFTLNNATNPSSRV